MEENLDNSNGELFKEWLENYDNYEITKEVYNYCLEEKIADAKLIAKWKKQGFEKLCCLMCIQNKNHNFYFLNIRIWLSSLEP